MKRTKGLVVVILVIALLFSMACLVGGKAAEENESSENEVDVESPEEEIIEENEAEPVIEEELLPTQEQSDEEVMEELPSETCGNEYFPIIEGRILAYETVVEEFSDWKSSYEVEYRDVTSDGFSSVTRTNTLDENGEVVEGEFSEIEIHWGCGENGMLQEEYNSFLFNEMDESMQVEFETLSFEGITFPVDNNIQIGSSWDNNYVISMITTDDEETTTNTVTIAQTHTATAIEGVVIPYAEFEEAVLVETVGEFSIASTNDAGNTFTYTLPIEFSSWYVKGIGMVKMVTAEEGFTTTQLLVDIID